MFIERFSEVRVAETKAKVTSVTTVSLNIYVTYISRPRQESESEAV